MSNRSPVYCIIFAFLRDKPVKVSANTKGSAVIIIHDGPVRFRQCSHPASYAQALGYKGGLLTFESHEMPGLNS